jgi:hypothetical protein
MGDDPVGDALEQLKEQYGDLSYVRDDADRRVVRRLRGNFQSFVFEFGFDADTVVGSIGNFWTSWSVLFDPGQAIIGSFAVTSMSAQLVVVTGQQVEEVDGELIEVSGAVLTVRVAARSSNSWQVDGFDSTLIVGTPIEPTLIPLSDEAAAREAATAVFGQPAVKHLRMKRIRRVFPIFGAQYCRQIFFPAQPPLGGHWSRGAVVYWPLNPTAPKEPFHVEPDGSYADASRGNTGPYHGEDTILWARRVQRGRQDEPPEQPAERRKGRVLPVYQLVNDSFVNNEGPMINTGHLPRDPFAPVVPLEGTRWRHDEDVLSRVNPGVVTDAHAFTHDVVAYFLQLRDRNDIVGTILPDPLNVAVQVYPAAQPGEWRKSNSTVVIANADDSLPRSWMKRWTYCSDKSVVAHEITHALTYECCTFDYCLESGALDEALADLFAVLITRSPTIFDAPWIREDTRYVDAVDALRDASWPATPYKADYLTPNARVERGKYPNHYADFARLAAKTNDAVRRLKPKNDHGYIHWNCTIVTRALAALAQPLEAAAAQHPETGMKVVGIGADYVADLVFCAMRDVLNPRVVSNSDTLETPFSQLRSALLNTATSTKFDKREGEAVDRRLFAARLINTFNAVGIGPILSVRGRPEDVPSKYMPNIRLNPPEWVMKFEQGGNVQYWNPGDAGPIDLGRAQDFTVTVQIANLGISSDRAIPQLSVLVETAREESRTFAPFDLPAQNNERLGCGEVMSQSVTIPKDDFPDLPDPYIMVVVTDQWNSLRSNATARAAIMDNTFDLPLNAALLRLRLQ